LGARDDELDKNEKTKFGGEAMQKCDRIFCRWYACIIRSDETRVTLQRCKDVDARHKAGHDNERHRFSTSWPDLFRPSTFGVARL
jgi:hypothetical protein